jgi:hypothetical protein
MSLQFIKQLLTDVVHIECPEVEEAGEKLIVEIAEMKGQLDSQMKKTLNCVTV